MLSKKLLFLHSKMTISTKKCHFKLVESCDSSHNSRSLSSNWCLLLSNMTIDIKKFMSSHVISCHPMSSYVILCNFISFHVILCHLMSSYVILCQWSHVTQLIIHDFFKAHSVFSCHLVLSYVILCHLMSFYVSEVMWLNS